MKIIKPKTSAVSLYQGSAYKASGSKSLSIKPLSNHSIVADFNGVYKHTMFNVVRGNKGTPHRVLNLRPSQMPFCAVSFFIRHANKGLYQELDMAGAFYTSVGTTVHEVMQNYLCQSGRYLADYHCKECGKWHRQTYKHHCCGFPTQYHELEISYKGVKGHIDGVYRDRQGKLWIVDFKTTSVAGAVSKARNPGIVYIEQIETYAVLVELQYGIEIEGIMDAFILRDNPMKDPAVWARPLTDEMRKTVKRRLSRYKKAHRDALDAMTQKEAVSLLADHGRCQNPDCKFCKKGDDYIKEHLRLAYKAGKAKRNVPIREMAERELAEAAKSRRSVAR